MEKLGYIMIHNRDRLQDGGKTIISCSSCAKPLIEIWVIQPQLPIKSKIYATCPYCGDRSFLQEFHGKFSVGHLDDTVITEMKEEEFHVKENGSIIQKIKIIVVEEK